MSASLLRRSDLLAITDDSSLVTSKYDHLTDDSARQRAAELLTASSTLHQIYSLLDSDSKLINNPAAPVYQAEEYLFSTSTDPFSLESDAFVKRVSKFYAALSIVDSSIVSALKSKVDFHRDSPSQATIVLSQYASLLSRPAVSKGLIHTLESTCDMLTDAASKTLDSLHSSPTVSPLKNATTDTSRATYLHSLSDKTKKLRDLVGVSLSQCSNFPSLASTLDELYNSSKELADNLFSSWVGTVTTLVNNNSLSITGKVLELDVTDGSLVVCFPEEALALKDQTREFSNLGYKVPSSISELAFSVAQYHAKASELKQIASFYNHIKSLIIPCQKPMLLKAAQNFEHLIRKAKNQSNQIVWSNTTQLDTYVTELTQASKYLEKRIRSLKTLHTKFVKEITKLYSTNLVLNQENWKSFISEVKSTIKQCEKEGLDVDLWRAYWNNELWRCFSVAFKRTLAQLPHIIDPIDTSLLVINGSVELKPSIFEVQQKYLKEISRICSLVWSFEGLVSFEKERRTQLLRESEDYLLSVYQYVSRVMKSLGDLVTKYKNWLNPALTQDVDAVCANSPVLQSFSDWQSALKQLKSKGKLVSKIPDNLVNHGISLSLTPFKTAADGVIKSVGEGLIGFMIGNTSELKTQVTEFIVHSQDFLDRKPQSLNEIGEAAEKAQQMTRDSLKFSNMLDEINDRNRILKLVNSSTVDIGDLLSQWSNFQEKLAHSDQILTQQKANLRQTVESRCQSFKIKSNKFINTWKEERERKVEVSNSDSVQMVIKTSQNLITEADQFKKELEQLLVEVSYFDLPKPDTEELSSTFNEIEDYAKQWDLFKEFSNELDKLGSETWFVMRTKLHLFEDFISDWRQKLSELTTKSTVYNYIKFKISTFNNSFHLLKVIRGDVFTPEHWIELFKLISFSRTKKASELLFSDILERLDNLSANEERIKNLLARAIGEVTIREALQEISVWANEVCFEFQSVSAVDDTKISLIKDVCKLRLELSDQDALLLSLKDSSYYHSFSSQIEGWDQKLLVINELVTLLVEVQRKWTQLQPVLLRNALPSETSAFKRIHSKFCSILNEIAAEQYVFSLLKKPDLTSILTAMSSQLSVCQSKLFNFLDEKRRAFPKFYFVGDDDLLEIIGQAHHNPNVVQPHLKKLFQGINHIHIESQGNSDPLITSFSSAEGEEVLLTSPIKVTDTPSDWLDQVSKVSKTTLREMTLKCLKELNINVFPSQVLCLANSILFSQKVEHAIMHKTLESLLSELNQELDSLTRNLNSFGENSIERVKLKALVLDSVHHQTVVKELIQSNVIDVNDWLWQSQLRFYVSNSSVVARCCDAEFNYSFEYQGNTPKLVTTPLSVKCFITLTQALKLGLGGNPFGPAGTGKTETVKALAQALGRQCLVFNCDEGVDFKSMTRIFTGLLLCGAWGCFDEFNRLDVNVLSAISQQIQVIQSAIFEKRDQVKIINDDVSVDHNSAVFVTLNPAGKGYGGRSVLPDNLKSLFRSIAMSTPDIEIITQVLLQAEGFNHSQNLSKKIVSFFSLSKVLFSQQKHYDWGLRAVKGVLGSAGNLLTESRRDDTTLTELDELQLVVKSLKLNVVSKLTNEDLVIFEKLVVDCFSKIDIGSLASNEMEQAILQSFTELGLELINEQLQKVLQLQKALEQKIGVVVLGPSGSGKSVIWKILHRALKIIGQSVNIHVINPKAMQRSLLLGHMDYDTRDFEDGVLIKAARDVTSQSNSQSKSWIVLDGDVDPEWIEALNSVLDDNKLLTLPSGERIQFDRNTNFIFETADLEFASPATVSRMGMILVAGPRELMDGIIKHSALNNCEYFDIANELPQLILKYSESFVLSKPTCCLSSIVSALPYCGTRQGAILMVVHLIGSLVASKVRGRVLGELFSHFKVIEDFSESELYCDENFGLTNQSIKDVMDDVIITPHSRLYSQLIKILIKSNQSFILNGPLSSGKTVCFNLAVKELVEEEASYSVIKINCSSNLGSNDIVSVLKIHCSIVNSSRGKVLRPKKPCKTILYLSNVDLIESDKYGSVEVVNFVCQLLSYQGFYDPQTLEFILVEGILTVLTCTSQSELIEFRSPLSDRLFSVCSILTVDSPSTNSLKVYLGELFAAKIGHVSSWVIDGILNVLNKCNSLCFNNYDHINHLFGPCILELLVESLVKYSEGISVGDLDLVKCLVFEVLKVFGGRIVDNSSRKSFFSQVCEIFSIENPAELPFFCPMSCAFDYPMMVDSKNLSAHFNLVVKNFNREEGNISLIPTPEVLNLFSHVSTSIITTFSKICSCLVVSGPSGLGRRSVVQLVCYHLNYPIVFLQLTRSYSVKRFKAELRSLVGNIISNKQRSVLFVENPDFINLEILEFLDHLILNQGLFYLFTDDEVKNLASGCDDVVEHTEFFKKQLIENLKIVVSLDSNSENFKTLLGRFPALFKFSTHSHTKSLLSSSMFDIVSSIHNSTFSEISITSDLLKLGNQLLNLSAKKVDPLYSAPRYFFTLFDGFAGIYGSKLTQFKEELSRLLTGLQKIDDATNHVAVLNSQAAEQQSLLSVKQAEADEALVQIQISMGKASEQKKEAETLAAELTKEEDMLQQRNESVSEQLSSVQPMIDAAKKQVTLIRSDHLAEIRGLRQPPEAIADVLEGVLKLLGHSDTSWVSMKKFLGKKEVKDVILNFDADSITPQIALSVKQLLSKKAKSFSPAVIQRVSQAAAPLAAWVKANISYSEVLLQVAPLTKEMKEITSKLNVSRKRLDEYNNAVKEFDEKIEELRRDFAEKTSQAESLKINLKKQEDIIEKATQLLDKLSAENGRWSSRAQELKILIENLPFQALYSAACITFLSNCTSPTERGLLQDQYKSLLGLDENFNMHDILLSERDVIQWQLSGISTDSISIENAIGVTNSERTPFIMDASGQVFHWLQETITSSSKNPVETVNYHDPRFVSILELSLRFGKILLVTNVDTVEPWLIPLLRGDVATVGSRKSIKLGDRSVEFNENFKIYLFTPSMNPLIPTPIKPFLSMVSFGVSAASLEEQLLVMVLRNENPELESRRMELLRSQEKLKTELVNVENDLLLQLSQSTGNILENSELISSLDKTKENSIKVTSSLEESERLRAQLDEERVVFAELAAYSSRLFSTCNDLTKVNKFYGFSLQIYFELFNQILEETSRTPSSSTKARIAIVISALTRKIFDFVSCSLLQKDRLVFNLHLIRVINPNLIGDDHWKFVTETSLSFCEQSDLTFNNFSAAINSSLARLKDCFPSLFESITGDRAIFFDWMDSACPEQEFSRFGNIKFSERLVLIYCLRPDRFPSFVASSCREVLGVSESSPSVTSLVQNCPGKVKTLLFVTTPGADPVPQIRESAINQNLIEVAMGQGQADLALNSIVQGSKNGNWVLIKNLHLAVDWLTTLDRSISSLSESSVHNNFRLILTTEFHSQFNMNIILNSQKITFESSTSIKTNFINSVSAMTSSAQNDQSNDQSNRLIVLSSWLHTIITSRLRFVPQGWTQNFEFSASDIRAACQVISNHSRKFSNVSNLSINYLIGLFMTVVYGSRVDSNFDYSLLNSLVQKLFNPEVISGKAKYFSNFPPLNPKNFTISAYLEDISPKIPEFSTDLLHLAANSGLAKSSVESKQIISTVKYLSMTSSEGQSINFDANALLRHVCSLIDLMHHFDLIGPFANQNLAVDSPVLLFFQRELSFLSRVCDEVSSDLIEIKSLVESKITISDPRLKNITSSINSDTVPHNWSLLMSSGSSPSEYLKILAKKRSNLVDLSKLNVSDSSCFIVDLGSFFNPITFLNCVCQQSSRKFGVTVDKLHLISSWNPPKFSEQSIVIEVTNLLLQGAMFNSGSLSKCLPNDPEWTPLPSCYLSFQLDDQEHKDGLFLPLYAFKTREGLVTTIKFDSSGEDQAFNLNNACLSVDS
ncbi:hypothetical protein P9112_005639 [Eukaryota sp. TZLM1-RC]